VNQRGFTLYIVIAAILVFGGMSVALKVQTSRLDACKQEFGAFRAEVKAKGEAAQRESARIDAENAKRKEKSDAERKRLLVVNAELAGKLRDNAGRSSLPEPTGSAGSPETACFRRADLDAAIREFTVSVSGIVTQGDSAVTDLDLARRWAQ
jgi:hypothetical protein